METRDARDLTANLLEPSAVDCSLGLEATWQYNTFPLRATHGRRATKFQVWQEQVPR